MKSKELIAMEWITIIISGILLIWNITWSIISLFKSNKQQKELNIIKDQLERSQYISNKQFDVELEILRELSKQLIVFTDAFIWLYPPFLDRRSPSSRDKEKLQQYRLDIYNETIEASNKFRDILQSNAPFINAELLPKFFDFRTKIHSILAVYEVGTLREDDDFIRQKEKELGMNIYSYTNEIIELKNNLLEDIRIYFQSLKTI
jgi:hypothetical protein